MLTEEKILEHANLLLEKRTLTLAEYPGWVQGATWAMREMEAKVAELERQKELYLQNWAAISKIVSQDAKDFQRKYDAALQLAQEYKEQSDKQKTQIAELLKKYEK